jgi:hypothetical protein
MNVPLILIIANLFFSISALPSFTSTADQKIRLDDIKKNYADWKIVKIRTFNRHVLVESRRPDTVSFFDLYNLDNGELSHLDTYSHYAKLIKIVNENRFIFFSSGKNHVNSYKDFPFIIECVRNNEGQGEFARFNSIRKPKYFKIGESVEFGNIVNQVLIDIIVDHAGLEILFGPNNKSYGAYTTIPPVKTIYHRDKNQFIILFTGTHLGDKFKLYDKILAEKNFYFQSVEAKKKGEDLAVIICLKKSAKFYTAEILNLMTKPFWPYVRFAFATDIPEED